MPQSNGLFATSGAALALALRARCQAPRRRPRPAWASPPRSPPRRPACRPARRPAPSRSASPSLYNERIDTSGTGVVQVLLLDGSTFTVGPNSNLVIDKFVYDPGRGKGELVASFTKGALRFIGGKLSKPVGGIQVKTPAGELTVRGGMFQGVVKGPNQASSPSCSAMNCRSSVTAKSIA